MANQATGQMNTSENPVQNLEELVEAEALSKVTGAGGEGLAGGIMGIIPGAAVGGVTGAIAGGAADKNKGAATGLGVGLGVGAASGAALGAVLGSKAKCCKDAFAAPPGPGRTIFNLGA
jgi:hypothetical protein